MNMPKESDSYHTSSSISFMQSLAKIGFGHEQVCGKKKKRMYLHFALLRHMLK